VGSWRLHPGSLRRRREVAALILAAGGLVLAYAAPAAAAPIATPVSVPALAFPQPCGNPGARVQITHVIWIWMENEAFGSVIGSPNAPYQTSLAHQCGLPTNFHNESHGSLDNYIAATSGENILGTSFVNDCSPNIVTKHCTTAGRSIFAQTEAAGETWRGYAEDMPSPCDRTSSGNYAVRHNPAPYFSTLDSCGEFDIKMGNVSTQKGAFYDDVAAGTLPSFSFISPNLVDDAHNSDAATGDAWLSKLVPIITKGANYQRGDTAIFITNDEGAGADLVIGENCSDPTLDLKQPSCHIPTIVIAPHIPTGTVDDTFYTHYSMLRTAEEVLGLPLLGLAADANSMTASFDLEPSASATPPGAPTKLVATTSGPKRVHLTWKAATAGSAAVAGYQILRRSTVLATVPGTSYVDKSVKAGTSYRYRVRAVDAEGLDGPASTRTSVTTLGVTNLLKNPGFETWSHGAATGWAKYDSTTRLVRAKDSHSGRAAIRISSTSGAATSAGILAGRRSTVMPTVPGRTYTASCWAKVSGPLTVRIRLHENRPGGASAHAAAVTSLAITDTRWHQLQVPDTTVGRGNKLRLAIYSTSVEHGGATVLVDDCALSRT
jgi:phosphatidylinositol-3-phosphatase